MSDVMDDWVYRVLGVPLQGAGKRPADSAETAVFTRRLAAIRQDMESLGVAPQFAGDLKAAAEAAKARDDAAPSLISALESQLGAIASERRNQKVREEIGKATQGKSGVVGFAKVRLKWNAARNDFQRAGANLETALRTVLATPALADDPRSQSPDLESKVKSIAGKLPDIEKLGAEIDDTLDAIGTKENSLEQGGPTREQRIAAAVKAIDAYLAELASDPMLKALQSGAAGGLPIVDLIASSLTALRTELAG